MNRERYLQLRRAGNNIEILYEAVKEFTTYEGSLYHFSNSYIAWAVPGQDKDMIVKRLVDHYDIKFIVHLVYIKDKLIAII